MQPSPLSQVAQPPSGGRSGGGGPGTLDYTQAQALLGRLRMADAAVEATRLQVQDLQEKLHVTAGVRDFLRRREEDLERQLAAALEERDAAVSQRGSDRSTISFLDERCEALRAEGGTQARQLSAATARANAAEARVKSLEAAVASLHEQAAAAEQKFRDSQAAVAAVAAAAPTSAPLSAGVAAGGAAAPPATTAAAAGDELLSAMTTADLASLLRAERVERQAAEGALRLKISRLVAEVKKHRAADAAAAGGAVDA